MKVFQGVFRPCFVLVVLWCGLAQASEERQAAPVIEIETPIYHFGQVNQGEVIKHDFRVFNRGNALLKIKSVKPG